MPKDASPEIMPDLGISTLFSMKGKVALVTGGGTGIGKMITAAFIQNGAKVYISSRKLDEIKVTAKELSKSSPKGAVSGDACIALQSDLGSKKGCDDLAAQILERESELHVLVNNSGLTWGAPMDDFPEEKGWDKVFDLNVKSNFYLTVALLPILEKNKNNIDPARVINIASTAAFVPMANTGLGAPGTGTFSYNPSKAAAVHLTRTMANTLADRNVLVNAICPGVFPSRMTAYGVTENKELLEAGQPTGRLGGPEDIGGLAIFLSSRAGSHLTGTATAIDGGASMQWIPRL